MLVTPKPLPVSTIVEASCTAASAMAELPMTTVSAARGNFTILALFMVTSIPTSALEGEAIAAAMATATISGFDRDISVSGTAKVEREDERDW